MYESQPAPRLALMSPLLGRKASSTMTAPLLLSIAPWLPERSRPGRCRLGLRYVVGVVLSILLLIYMLVVGFMLLLLSIPRFLLRLLLQPALGYFGHIVEYAYTLRICKLHVKLSRAVQKKWLRRPYHSRFSDIRTRLYPSDGGVCHVHAVPCLTDNFCYVLVSEGLGEARSHNGLRQGLAAVVVDPCDAAAVEEALEHIAETFYAGYGGLRLEGVLCTHKHWDHAGGNEELAARASQTQSCTDSATESESQDVTAPQLLHFAEKLKVFGGLEDDVPGCTDPVQHLDCIEIANLSFQAIGAPGHTQGSVMFRLACKAQPSETDIERQDALFTGDTLFSGGCGANFEGSELDMEHCFGTILETCEPSYKTWLFPGHEYTCMLIESALVEACDKAASRPPGYFIAVCSAFYTAAHRRALRDRLPTVPVLLDGEQMVNPRFKALRRHARTLLAAAQQAGVQGEATDLSVGTANQVPAFLVPQSSASSRKIATGQEGEGQSLLVDASGAPPPHQLAVLYRADLDALRAELSAGTLAGAEAAERLRQLERRPFEGLLSGEADCFDDSGLKPEEEEAIKQEAAYGQPRDLPTDFRPSEDTEWNEVPVKDALKALAVPAHLAVGPKVACKEEDLPISFRRLKAIYDHLGVPSRSSSALLAVLHSGENPSSEEEEQHGHCCVTMLCCCQSARGIVAGNVGDESPHAERLIRFRTALSSLTPPDVKRLQEESFFQRMRRCLPCSRSSGSSGQSSAESAQESGGEGSEPTTEPPELSELETVTRRRRRFRAIEKCFNKHQPEGCPLCTSSFRPTSSDL